MAIPGILKNLTSQFGAEKYLLNVPVTLYRSAGRPAGASANLPARGYNTGTTNNAMEMSMAFSNMAQATSEYQAAVTNLTMANITLTE